MTTYTTCPSCGSQYPIGSQHDCPTHLKPSLLLAIAGGVLLFMLLVGFSCNLHVEIKQTPTDAAGKEK